MRVKTVYIDDEDKELKKWKIKFEDDERSKELFKVVSINSQKQTIDELLSEIKITKPELILVDFDLSKPQKGSLLGISGATLSTALKEKFPDIPAVLFTKKSVFKIEKYSRQALYSLDNVVYKNEVFQASVDNLNQLHALAVGFKNLRKKQSPKWDDILKVIKAPQIDYETLKLSNPSLFLGGIWSVSEVAKWVRKTLIEYPGILYDPIHSATFLGLSESEFLSEKTKEIFAKAKYSGVFAPGGGRWWKSELRKIAISKMIKKERELPLYLGFPSALERIRKTQVERSKCIYSGETPADWVCYILNKPVKIKYSLAYRVDSRPEVMDEARVSFKAIKTSNEVNDELFDPLGKDILGQIRKGKSK